MKIAIVGAAGRMGQMLCKLAEGSALEVVSRIDVAEGYDREWCDDVEGVIDFYTLKELDPKLDEIEEALQGMGATWELDSVQFEPDSRLIHFSWSWKVG